MKSIFKGLLLVLLCSCTTSPTGKMSGEEKEVVSLITRMTIDENKQMESLAKLEALGCKYAPYMIMHMDDRRKLPSYLITFENFGTNNFEGARHYKVELVVDALDALLNQITGLRGHDYDYGEATEEDRIMAVSGWEEILEKHHGNLCG